MTTEIYIGSILRTKLHRPPVPRDHVDRQRLLAYPDQRRDRPLTLVNTQTLPLLPVLAASLANEMDAIAQDFIVVLDGRRPEWVETTGITVPKTWRAARAAGIAQFW
jgi:hypothetical protein